VTSIASHGQNPSPEIVDDFWWGGAVVAESIFAPSVMP